MVPNSLYWDPGVGVCVCAQLQKISALEGVI